MSSSNKHTNVMADEHANVHAPPTYEDSMVQPIASTDIEHHRTITFLSTIPELDYTSYIPPGCSVTSDSRLVTIACPADPDQLQEVLKQQLHLPPRAELRIRGSHKELTESKVDFDLKIDMLRYLVSTADSELHDPQMKMLTAKLPMSLQQQSDTPVNAAHILGSFAVSTFISEGGPKRFTINRKVSNWDLARITERVRALTSELNYKGTLNVELRTGRCSTVTILAKNTEPKPKAKAPWFAPIASYFETAKAWEVDAVWPFADHPETEERRSRSKTTRRCNVCDEEEWWQTWKGVIRRSMLERKSGWVGAEEWLDATMGPLPGTTITDSGWKSWLGGSVKADQTVMKPWGVDKIV